MPIYEFRCDECGRVTDHFTRHIDTAAQPACAHCGSPKTTRTMSRFGRVRSRQDVVDQYGDSTVPGADAYRDPRQIGSWAEKRLNEYGMDMPAGVRDMIDAAREGEFPDPVNGL